MTIDGVLERFGARAQRHAPLGPLTTYRRGGAAAVLVTVENDDELIELAELLGDTNLATLVVGRGSNLLVASGEHPLAAVVLGDGFTHLATERVGDTVTVHAGAAWPLPQLARRLAEEGSDFAWAVGVPGSIGGAVAMNAGGHGSDMAHCVTAARVVDLATATAREWSRDELAFGYRTSALRSHHVVVAVTLSLAHREPDVLRAEIAEVVRWRREHQPGGANAGSVFTNPRHAAAGRLIDAAGAKGLRRGGAWVSDKHANFIQLDPDGTPEDVRAVIDEVRALVAARSGVTLRTELRMIGFTESP